jgi:hypothetical protein
VSYSAKPKAGIFYWRSIRKMHLRNSETINITSFELGFDFAISLLIAESSKCLLCISYPDRSAAIVTYLVNRSVSALVAIVCVLSVVVYIKFCNLCLVISYNIIPNAWEIFIVRYLVPVSIPTMRSTHIKFMIVKPRSLSTKNNAYIVSFWKSVE